MGNIAGATGNAPGYRGMDDLHGASPRQTVRFRPAAELTPEAVAAIAEQVRIRVLRWFARSGLIERDDVREMLAWENSGFSLGRTQCATAVSSPPRAPASNARSPARALWAMLP